jgi:hypothetical protein
MKKLSTKAQKSTNGGYILLYRYHCTCGKKVDKFRSSNAAQLAGQKHIMGLPSNKRGGHSIHVESTSTVSG